MLFTVWKRKEVIDQVIIDTYSTWNFYYAFMVSQLCRFFSIPYAPILHGGNLPTRLDRSPRMAAAIFRHSSANIAPSGYLKHEFMKRDYGVVNIPNNIPIHEYPFKERRSVQPRLLFVRALKALYNPTMAIHVLAKLKEHYADATLCMVGADMDGSLRECEELARELGVSDRVQFTGRISKEKWRKLSEQYDIFISTTNFDNTPVSVIEAMALGLPVVSTNPGGVPYLIKDGITGLLVDCGNVEAMSTAIASLIKNSESAGQLSHAARKQVEAYSWTVVAEQWKKLLAG